MKRNERGSALVAVLALLFTAGILAAMTLAIVKRGTFDVAGHVALQRSMYEAEGLANRAIYLACMDRALYSEETLGETDYEALDYDRYLPDAIPHRVDYYGTEAEFTLTDTLGGWDFSSSRSYRNSLNALTSGHEDDTDLADKVEVLRTRIADYLDSDDDIGTDGLEKNDYEELGKAPLPRNDELQFREELLYIPGFRELFPTDRRGVLSSVRLIPPENTVSLDGNPSLLAASDEQLRSVCNLEDDEVIQVRAAIDAWKKNRTKLSDSLPDLMGKLTPLSRRESGIYTVEIGIPAGGRRPFRRLRFSFQAFGTAGPSDQKLRFLEWFFL